MKPLGLADSGKMPQNKRPEIAPSESRRARRHGEFLRRRFSRRNGKLAAMSPACDFPRSNQSPGSALHAISKSIRGKTQQKTEPSDILMFVSSIWHKHFRRRLVPVTDFDAKCRLLASVDVYVSLSLAPASRLLSSWSHRRSQALIRLFPCRYFREIFSVGPTIAGAIIGGDKTKVLSGRVFSCFHRNFHWFDSAKIFSLYLWLLSHFGVP